MQIDVANETKGYGADIADEMVKKILDAQSSEVDGHSGATITSDAIKKAAESCINQAKGVAVAPTEANKAETVVPEGLTTEEVESSVCELGDITPDETKDFDVVVVGAGAAGVPAAGWAAELGGHVALLQKQSVVVSQGNCGSAIIKSKSTEAGKKMWVHMTNSLCDWRSNTDILNAYVENSEEAMMWYLNRAGLTDETEYGDGAKMENLGHTKMMHDFDSGLMYEEPFLYVNMEGKRFCNEDTGFVYMGNITKYLPKFNGNNVDANHPDGSLGWYCQIYDSDYMNYANSPVPEQVMTKYIPGAVENPQGVFANLIDTYKADTIEELAGLLGIPADELQKTIDRYNELCDKGSDVDFGKKSTYMHKIEKAPFWGIRKHIRVSAICAGVNTNANGQALDTDGNVIDGLYCVGNVGGVFYGGADYPFHQTGLSLGRCYTFGMLAAKHAMGQL